MLRLLLFIVLLGPAVLRADSLPEVLQRHGVHGTLLIASLDGKTEYLANAGRAGQPFPVASTFKIANSLIALQEGAITPDEVLVWDGQVHESGDWNRDQTLESAFRVSCVWCYQQLARRIGAQGYVRWLPRLGLGPLPSSFAVDRFWLDGTLQASARDQVRFLRRLLQGDLPFDAAHLRQLRLMMRADGGPGWTLYGKTGWAARAEPQIGWYVGYVEARDQVWLFALNMDISQREQLPLRQRLVREGLQAVQLLP